MEWNKLIEARHTTFAWDEENIPERELIEDAIREVYNHIPSKNLMFPYQVRILKNDDPEIKKSMMTICHRNQEMPAEQDRGNPQVLAPWLIGFNARWIGDLERRFEKTSDRGKYNGNGRGNVRTNDPNGSQTQTENIEIGLFSAYIMLALADRGIQTGMCQNVCNDYERVSKIFKVGDDERSMDFRFVMGAGYGKDIYTRHNYFDPRIGKEKPIPFPPVDVEKYYPRPDFDEVIKFI